MEAWHWPQWLFLTLNMMTLVGGGMLHDKPRTGKHNGITTMIQVVTTAAVLHFGGFW